MELYTLTNRNGLVAKITNFGGHLTELQVPDRHGHMADVVLGHSTLEHYLFYGYGQIGIPVNEAHGVSVVSSNGVTWPDAAGAASGRPYHSVLNIKLSSGQVKTANVTVQGGGTQSVSVPAGTYRATVVTMTMVSKVGSFTTTAVVKVWTAAGTGPVKTQQVVKAGGKTQLITTSELVSFTRQAAGS